MVNAGYTSCLCEISSDANKTHEISLWPERSVQNGESAAAKGNENADIVSSSYQKTTQTNSCFFVTVLCAAFLVRPGLISLRQ